LNFGIGDSDLEKLFAAYGSARSAQVIKDRYSGQSKGLGFVEMSSNQEAQAAIAPQVPQLIAQAFDLLDTR